MSILTKEISEGEVIPHGYGIAWRRWDVNATVVMPLPFNHLARWLRDAYQWLRFTADPSAFDEQLRHARLEGASEAYERGYASGYRYASLSMQNAIDAYFAERHRL